MITEESPTRLFVESIVISLVGLLISAFGLLRLAACDFVLAGPVCALIAAVPLHMGLRSRVEHSARSRMAAMVGRALVFLGLAMPLCFVLIATRR